MVNGLKACLSDFCQAIVGSRLFRDDLALSLNSSCKEWSHAVIFTCDAILTGCFLTPKSGWDFR